MRLNGNNNAADIFGSSNTMIFLNGVGNTAGVGATDNTVSVLGVNNIVDVFGVTPDTTPGNVAIDHGLGTMFQVEEGSHLTIQDFQSDATGIIDLGTNPRLATPAQAVAAETSDGHGGTMLSLPGASGFPPVATPTTIDFVGDPHVDISHFV